jgi:P4 family phage/plasmid primase-like protien
MKLPNLLALIEAKTHRKPEARGDGYSCRCPAHEDQNPSLSVSMAPDGRTLIKCHAGCAFDDVAKALGLSARDFAPEDGKANGQPGRPAKFKIAATYDYQDAKGELRFQVCRMDPKDFRQRRPDANALDGWIWKIKGVRQVPFRLPALIAAVKGGLTVFVAEGEKDVECLVAHGLEATCNAGGAGKWRAEFGEYFDGAKSVVVIADKDDAGRKHAADVGAKLKQICRSVKVIELPDIEARPVKDAADFFAAGGTAEAVEAFAAAAPEYVPKAELTPGTWFKQRFPKLAERYGEPTHETITGNRAKVREACEDFMAATLGADGMPEAPTVFLPCEGRFYTYDIATGIFGHRREEEISARMSALFLECGRASRETADTSKLEFGMRDTAALTGIIKRARGLLAVREDYFSTSEIEFLPVANGMLRLSDRQLLPFSPNYRRRHKMAVPYVAGAQCPQFIEGLLNPALETAEIDLIQRWAGLALIGRNMSQKMLILTGTPGGGKSTLVSILTRVIGETNVGLLRTEFLGDRFELGRHFGKTLLYGPDVPENFLNLGTASSLKSLTGGDMMTLEFKNSNESPLIKCEFNIVVTSNSRLTIHLEGDADAWRRRLLIVNYERPKPKVVIPTLAEDILIKEGPGVLNFMLEGLGLLRNENWQLRLTENQQRRVDDLLLESDSHRVFAAECLIKDSTAPGMTKAEVYSAYVEFCDQRGWVAMTKNRFGKIGAEAVTQIFGLALRGDILGNGGKQNDGWKNLRLKTGEEGDI